MLVTCLANQDRCLDGIGNKANDGDAKPTELLLMAIADRITPYIPLQRDFHDLAAEYRLSFFMDGTAADCQ